MKRYIIHVLCLTVFCLLSQATAQTKWSELSTTWPLASGDKIVGIDISDTTMGVSGTNKATTLTALTTYFSTALQPLDATLTALSGATTGADILSYWTGTDTLSSTTLSSFARSVLDDADAPTFRATIGAGTGSGTVTTLSVVTANGISGSVATATTTPAITLDITALDATKIGGGGVSTTEFNYLASVTSDIQTQLDTKGVGDMLKSVYDPDNTGWISGSSAGGTGGTLKMDSLLGTGDGGDIWTYGGGGGAGGRIHTHGDESNGGNIETNGGSTTNTPGGNIITSGGTAADATGGTIDTSGGSLPGGSITMSNGGGSINTLGTGTIQLGVAGTRTTLTGGATGDRAAAFPANGLGGTVPLVEDVFGIIDIATEATISAALTFPDNVRQTFNPGANVAGFNVGSFAGDPDTLVNGDVWYDSTANELTARINGASVALGGGSSGITINTTAITGGTDTYILYDNAGTVGKKAVTGTGNAVLATGSTITTPVIADYMVSNNGNGEWALVTSNMSTPGLILRATCSIRWTDGLQWYQAAVTGIESVSAGVVRITDGSTGGGILEMPQVASGGTVSSNSSRLYSKDVAGTAEMFVKDEAGNETQISPHAGDAPEWLSDESAYGPDRIIAEFQTYTGRVRFTNESRRARLLELMLDAQMGSAMSQVKLAAIQPPQRKIVHEETFDEYNLRTGIVGTPKALIQLDWKTQQKKQRDDSIAKHAEWETRKAAHLAEEAKKLPKDARPFGEQEPTLVTIKPEPDFLKKE